MEKYIRQAKSEVRLAEKEWKRQGGWNVPCELQGYVLFVCNDGGVQVVGCEPTAGDFAALITAKNLDLLAAKYNAEGFVIKRTPKHTAEWSYVPAKVKGGAK